MKIEVIYKDPQLVIVNKPAGLPVHETLDAKRPNVHKLLEKQLGESLVLFHRLDMETSGVLCFGRDPAINRAMTEKFRDREIKKIYWLVVDGRWMSEWAEVKTFIKKLPGGKWGNVPKGKGGAFAHTKFEMLNTNGERSFLEADLQTGRTHQIRLHCLEMNHPICGDSKYGRANKFGVPMALHAKRLEFLHPTTNKPLVVEAELPSYWQEHYLLGLNSLKTIK